MKIFNVIAGILIIITGFVPFMIMSIIVIMGKIDGILYIKRLPEIIHYYIFLSILIINLYYLYKGIRYLIKAFNSGDNSYLSESGGAIAH